MSLLTCTWLASDRVIEPGPVEISAGSGCGGGRAFVSTTIVGPR